MTDYRQVFAGLQLRWLVTLNILIAIGAHALMTFLQFAFFQNTLPPESQPFFEGLPNVLSQLTFLMVLWLICVQNGFSPRKFWQKPLMREDGYGLFLLFIPLFVIGFTINFLQSYVLMGFFDTSLHEISTPAEQLNPSGMWIVTPGKSLWYQGYNALSLFSMVLLAPFVEELFFRGIALHRFSLKYGTYKGLWCSALLFGIFHGYNTLDAIVFGLVLGAIYLQTRNLKITFCWHMLHNGTVALLTIIGAHGADLEGSWLDIVLSALMLGVLGAFLIFLPTGIRWFRQQRMAYTAPLFQEPVE